jgi:hypothetical protein
MTSPFSTNQLSALCSLALALAVLVMGILLGWDRELLADGAEASLYSFDDLQGLLPVSLFDELPSRGIFVEDLIKEVENLVLCFVW